MALVELVVPGHPGVQLVGPAGAVGGVQGASESSILRRRGRGGPRAVAAVAADRDRVESKPPGRGEHPLHRSRHRGAGGRAGEGAGGASVDPQAAAGIAALASPIHRMQPQGVHPISNHFARIILAIPGQAVVVAVRAVGAAGVGHPRLEGAHLGPTSVDHRGVQVGRGRQAVVDGRGVLLLITVGTEVALGEGRDAQPRRVTYRHRHRRRQPRVILVERVVPGRPRVQLVVPAGAIGGFQTAGEGPIPRRCGRRDASAAAVAGDGNRVQPEPLGWGEHPPHRSRHRGAGGRGGEGAGGAGVDAQAAAGIAALASSIHRMQPQAVGPIGHHLAGIILAIPGHCVPGRPASRGAGDVGRVQGPDQRPTAVGDLGRDLGRLR
jgi:hypothetical protein